MISNNLGVETVGSEGYRITGDITQNNMPVLEENYVRKMNANNGFSKGRMFRFIGSIPITEQLNAVQQGYNMDDEKDVYRYFGRNPDYMAVKGINTGASGRIIVK